MSDPNLEITTLAAGCFWGVELKLLQTDGVVSTCVGYTGGNTNNPSYHDVCYKNTGHVEAVQVSFDNHKISFEELLKIFWKIHNPTLLNRQGPDVGEQYRSAIFFHSDKQKNIAITSKNNQQKLLNKTILTTISPAQHFWKAEEYHQKYLLKNKIT